MKYAVVASLLFSWLLVGVATTFVLRPEVGTPTKQEIKYAQEIAAYALDPDAVKFRNIRTVEYLGEPVVCGEYNGKNVLGAYTGFRKFYVKTMDKSTGSLSTRVMAEHPEVPGLIFVIDMVCDPTK